MKQAFEESAKFFSLPIEHKINLNRKEYRGYTPLYAEKLDPSSLSRGNKYSSSNNKHSYTQFTWTCIDIPLKCIILIGSQIILINIKKLISIICELIIIVYINKYTSTY
jgi:hypothetical protein